MKTRTAFLSTLLLSATILQSFDFNSAIQSAQQQLTQPTNSKTTSNTTAKNKKNLSNSTISNGLKMALNTGVDYAIDELSKENGYLNNKEVKIPLPKKLAKVESLIRKAGGDKIADDLISSMNKAASKAVPKTANIFAETISNMSINDAQKILSGGDSAATDYFEKNSRISLKKAISPIVQESMEQNNVASYYKKANDFYQKNIQPTLSNSEVMSVAKNFGADTYLPSDKDASIEEYVTQKAIDGLFEMIASKESEIRKDPIAQTTSLLKKVFGN